MDHAQHVPTFWPLLTATARMKQNPTLRLLRAAARAGGGAGAGDQGDPELEEAKSVLSEAVLVLEGRKYQRCHLCNGHGHSHGGGKTNYSKGSASKGSAASKGKGKGVDTYECPVATLASNMLPEGSSLWATIRKEVLVQARAIIPHIRSLTTAGLVGYHWRGQWFFDVGQNVWGLLDYACRRLAAIQVEQAELQERYQAKATYNPAAAQAVASKLLAVSQLAGKLKEMYRQRCGFCWGFGHTPSQCPSAKSMGAVRGEVVRMLRHTAGYIQRTIVDVPRPTDAEW